MKKAVLALAVALNALMIHVAEATEPNAYDLPVSAEAQVLVIALVKVKPGFENAFLLAARKITDPTRTEAGNVSYDFYQSIDKDRSILFTTVEQWKSQEVLGVHMSEPYMTAFFKEVGLNDPVNGLFADGYPKIRTILIPKGTVIPTLN